MSVDKSRYKFTSDFKAAEKSFADGSNCVLGLFEACNKPAISSHSISATNLRMISENHEVVRCGMDLNHDSRTEFVQFRRASPKVASTFPGFCGQHDQQIFREIDVREFKISPRNLTLFMYRATAQEMFKKARNLAVFSSFKEMTDDGKFEIPHNIKYAQLGTELGLSDAYKHLVTIRTMVENNDFSSVRYACFKFAQIVPFSYLAAVNFRYFPQYNEFDLLEESRDEGCTIGVIPQEGGSIFFVVWRRGYERVLAPILKRFHPARSALEEFAFQLGVEHCENIFFRPSWFESLGATNESLLKKFILSNIDDYVTNPDARPFVDLFPKGGSVRPKLFTNSTSFRTKFS